MKIKNKYRVYAAVSGSKYLGEIEAENEEDAKDKALDLDEASISLCHHCSHQCQDPMVVSVEAELVDEGVESR